MRDHYAPLSPKAHFILPLMKLGQNDKKQVLLKNELS